jgi:hypothetical protein
MGFETQRHRGTQRSGGSGENSYQGASKALGVHPGKRGPRTAASDYDLLWGTANRGAWHLTPQTILPFRFTMTACGSASSRARLEAGTLRAAV